jgi:hypothetical protein
MLSIMHQDDGQKLPVKPPLITTRTTSLRNQTAVELSSAMDAFISSARRCTTYKCRIRQRFYFYSSSSHQLYVNSNEV